MKKLYSVRDEGDNIHLVMASSPRLAAEAVAFSGTNRAPIVERDPQLFTRAVDQTFAGFFATPKLEEKWLVTEPSVIDGE